MSESERIMWIKPRTQVYEQRFAMMHISPYPAALHFQDYTTSMDTSKFKPLQLYTVRPGFHVLDWASCRPTLPTHRNAIRRGTGSCDSRRHAIPVAHRSLVAERQLYAGGGGSTLPSASPLRGCRQTRCCKHCGVGRGRL